MDDKAYNNLQDKIFLANDKSRTKNTDILSKKLDTLTPKDFPKEIAVEIKGAEVVTIKGVQGIPGEKPTDDELLNLIKPLIPDPVKGDPGKDYILTVKDKKEIASKIKVPVVEKIIEKTEVIKEQPIVTNEIKEVAVADTAEQILEKLQSLKDAWLEVKSIKGLDKVLNDVGSNFLSQAKGFVSKSLRGMYDVDVMNIADQQSLIWSASKQKFVPGAATTTGGGGFTKLLSTEVPDGTNTIFTYSQKPLYIVSGGAWYEENNGWTWAAGQATLSVSPPAQALQLLAFV